MTMAFLALGALLTACKEEEDFGLPKITLDKYEAAIAQGEGSTTVQLTATRDWYIANMPEWIAVNPQEGKASTQPQTVTVSVDANDGYNRVGEVVFSIGLAKANLTVEQAGANGELKKGTGTLEDPFTATGAIEYVQELGNNVQSPAPVYVKGKIATITEQYSTEFGNATFTISDDGTAANLFTCYRIKYFDNKSWKATDDQIAVGDDVIVYGNVVYFNGKTPETAQNTAYMYNHNGKGGKGPQTEITASTIADFIAKADGDYYRLTGKVSGFKTGTTSAGKDYMQFNLTDDTGTILVYGFKDGQYEAWAGKIKNGGTAVLTGTYELYTNKNTGKTQDEVMNATIESFTEGEDPGPGEITSTTVADFIAKASATTYYRLTGTVSEFKTGATSAGKKYMQFTLTDDTASIVVYGFKDGEYEKWADKIKNGGTAVLTGTYELYTNNNTGKTQHEVMNCTIESFTEGSGTTDTITGTVAETIAAANGATVVVNEALVMAISKQGLVVSDGTANVYLYFDTKGGESVPDVQIGDKVKLEAQKDTYGGIPEFKSAKVSKLSSGNQVTYPEPKDITSSAASYEAKVSEYIQMTGTLKVSGNYYNVEFDGTSARVGSVSAPLESLGVSTYDGKKVTITGYYSGLASNKYINIVAVSIAPADPNAKYCTVSTTAINVKADATSASFEVNANAAWEAASDNSDFAVSPSSGSSDATVNVTFAANETDAAKVAHINVVCADAGVEAVVTITQAKPSSGEAVTISIDFTQVMSELPQGKSAGKTDGTYNWGGYDFVIHASELFYQGKTGDSFFLLFGKTDTYVQFPAIDGKSLTRVKFLTGASASENVVCDIAKADGTLLGINSAKLKKGTEYDWEVPGEPGAAYRFVVTNSYNAQFQTLTLIYE